MSLVTLQSAGFDYGRQTILEGANLTLNQGERYGLIGVNGAGKSTLIRLIAGELRPLRGSVQKASKVSIGHLTQDTTLDGHEPLIDEVRRKAFGELLAIESRLAELTARMGEGDDDPALLEEYGVLHERFESADGYTMDARCESALQGLGFAPDRLDQHLGGLSGGQKRRAALAAVLLAPHDVLLLDEPTNHLDLEAREWLEEHLRERKGAVMIISHDRTFLDNTTLFTLHLYNGRLDRFTGGYTKFHRAWVELKAQWEERYARQQEHIAKTEAYIRKNIAGQRTNQAKSRRKQLARLDRLEAPPTEGRQYNFDLNPARESGQVVFEAQSLAQRYGALTLFEDLDLQVLKGDKIGIIGANGTGKTTLLRCLTREITPTEGTIRRGHNVDLGYYDQNLSLVNDTNTVLGELRSLDPVSSDGALRSLLAAFGFGDDMVDQPVRTLSGGERARLSLLHLIFERHNTLLLDEPTNHLDTDAREALEESLADYDGTLICVSHDRYFLNRICDRILAFEIAAGGGPGGVVQVLGNYDEYRRRKQRELEEWQQARQEAAREDEAPIRSSRGPTATDSRGAGATAGRGSTRGTRGVESRLEAPVPTDGSVRKSQLSKNQLSKIRREIADLEEEIELIEAELEHTSERMSGSEVGGQTLADLAEQARLLQTKHDEKMQRWEQLNALMER